MKKLTIILLSLFSLTCLGQVSSPDSLSVGGGLSIDSVYIDANDSLVFRFTNGSLYDLARYTTGGGAPPEPPPARYHVSTSGSDVSGNGSEAFPWQTLAYAESQATSPGDTVALRRGDTFLISSTLTFSADGTDGNNIVWDGSLWGDVGDTAIVQNNGVGLTMLILRDVEYRTFQNIIWDGNSTNTNGFNLGGIGSGTDDCNNITIRNCDIRNFGSVSASGVAIFMRPDDNNVEDIIIDSNRIRNMGTHCVGVYKASSFISAATNYNILVQYNTIENFRLFNASGNGVILRNESDSVTIQYNTFTSSNVGNVGIGLGQLDRNGGRYSTRLYVRYNEFDIEEGTVILMDQGDTVTANIYGNIIKVHDANSTVAGLHVVGGGDDWDGADINFFNNTVINSGHARGTLFAEWPSYSFLEIRNNIFYDNDGSACQEATDFVNITHTNNQYYKVGTTYTSNRIHQISPALNLVTDGQVQGWEATSQVSDPTFTVDFTNLNLQAGSDAIDGGVAITIYTEDRQGVAVVNPPNIGQSETTE